jgi:hypothetical protein
MAVPTPRVGELGDVKYMGISQDLIDQSVVLLGFMYKGMTLPPPLKTFTSILLTYIENGLLVMQLIISMLLRVFWKMRVFFFFF